MHVGLPLADHSGSLRAQDFRRPSGAGTLFCPIRWLAPPANFRRPSGPKSIVAGACLLVFCAFSVVLGRDAQGQNPQRVYSEELLMRPIAGARTTPAPAVQTAPRKYSEELLMRALAGARAVQRIAAPRYSEELLMRPVGGGRPMPQPNFIKPESRYSEELLMRRVGEGPVPGRTAAGLKYSEELLMQSLNGGGNPQQPPLLPTDPLNSEAGSPWLIFPDEMPVLGNGEFGLPPLVEEPHAPTGQYRLQLALNAMQPLLPPLELPRGTSLADSPRVLVRKFVFEGNHVFTDAQLRKLIAQYAGRTITPEELEEARVALTKHYIEEGYITSGAVLPDQDVRGGVVKFQLVEGRLREIDVRGNFWYRSWWLRHQLYRAAGQPFNFTKLKLGLQLMRQDPTISRINAEVAPGAAPGETRLEFAVKDEQPFRLGFEFSNKRPPSVSEGLGELYFTDLNLTGHGDPLELRWGLLRWQKDGTIEYADLDDISGAYEFPVSPWGTTLRVRADRSDSSIIDETFAELGITSREEEFGLTLRQPFYETLTNTVSVSVSADRKHSETFLLGRPFTLALGALDGESDLFATRFAIDWVNRSSRHVLALRSVFSFGLYAFGSTRADPRSAQDSLSGGDPRLGLDPEIPDSKFFAWLGQAQLVARIFDTASLRAKPDEFRWNVLRETQLIVRANVQLSDEPLLSLEQFSLGGMQSVRGYRENQLLRDDGLFASAELRVPLWLAKDKTPIVALAPFFDFGAGWDINKLDDRYQAISSAGIGVLVKASRHAQLSLYWGHPFKDFNEQKTSLQDYGLHFALTISGL